jgi:glycosyltransferase involved in cell wall biosynthesis
MKKDLAIVIPAYKESFLSEALDSVACQSNPNFTLYVGDDTGTGQLKDIVQKYAVKLDLVYKAFPENIGTADLASHWERCIELTADEKYIWLFSDDDIMPADAVERFYNCVKLHSGHDLYRFNILQTAGDMIPVSSVTAHPEIEASYDFLIRRLKGVTLSAACEYIFSREIFKKYGGLVHFPLAWCTDDASWYLFGKERGIVTIPGEPVLWRISGKNITSSPRLSGKKYCATLKFFLWLDKDQNIKGIRKLIPAALKRQSAILEAGLKEVFCNFISLLMLLGPFKLAGYMIFMLKINSRQKDS